MKSIDLHMHSNFSMDGELSPDTLVRRSAQAGLTTIAITDHNCVRAVAGEKLAAKMYGLQVISGAEYDCIFGKREMHILAYGIDENRRELMELEQNIMRQECRAGGLRMEMVRKCGIFLDGAWLCRNAINGVINGELIAQAALHDKQNEDNPRLRPYRPGGERGDNPYLNFCWDFCSPGKPAYVPIRYQSAEDIIELIHSCGGVAVLAHPGAEDYACGEEEIEQLTELGLDGLEIFNHCHTAEQMEFYLDCAQEYQLLITCGSGFHGKTKPSVTIGEMDCAYTQEHFEQLMQAIRNQNRAMRL